MPHYADGSEAKVGDHVTGPSHGTTHDIAGTVVGITSRTSATCNLQVAYLSLSRPEGIWGLTPMVSYRGGEAPVLLNVMMQSCDADKLRKVGAPEPVPA